MFINKSKIQFEIYSQPKGYEAEVLRECLSINQRYNLKSIHNDRGKRTILESSVYQ